MKHFKIITVSLFTLLLIFACHKEQRGPWKLNSGNGIWQLESMEWTTYDTLGNATGDSIVTNLGELVFLKTNWGTSRNFMGKYVHFDSTGVPVQTYPMDYNSDGKKISINGTFPIPLSGFFNMDRNGKATQRWYGLTYYFSQSIPNRIKERVTITLKKGKS